MYFGLTGLVLLLLAKVRFKIPPMLDLVLGLILLYATAKGFFNGFMAELASLLSIVIGIYAAFYLSEFFRGVFETRTDWNSNIVFILSFGIPFLLAVIGVTILAKTIAAMMSLAGLGLANRLGGAFLGLLKMIVITGVILNIFHQINDDASFAAHESLERSWFYEPIRKVGASVYPMVRKWF